LGQELCCLPLSPAAEVVQASAGSHAYGEKLPAFLQEPTASLASMLALPTRLLPSTKSRRSIFGTQTLRAAIDFADLGSNLIILFRGEKFSVW
jgi:hypothetical protein